MMIRTGTIAAALGAAVMAASPALAVTVSNQDGKEHTLTIDRGAQEDRQKIAAGGDTKIDCPERCEFRVQGMGYGRTAGSGEKLIIGKGGLIQFPGEAAPDKPRNAS